MITFQETRLRQSARHDVSGPFVELSIVGALATSVDLPDTRRCIRQSWPSFTTRHWLPVNSKTVSALCAKNSSNAFRTPSAIT